MDFAVSLYFNIDRTYITGINRKSDKISLEYINSTSNKIDIEDFDSPESVEGVAELLSIFGDLNGKTNSVNVVIPSESIIVTKFPYDPSFSKDNLRKLVKLEMSNIYPGFKFEDFMLYGVPLEEDKSGKRFMLAVIINKSIYFNIKKFTEELNLPLNKIEISQLNAHLAFRYNYPEIANENAMFVSIQDNFMDVSIMKNGLPLYYNLIAVNDKMQIGELLENEYNSIIEKKIDSIPYAFFFGSGLTKDINMMCWETSMMLGMESKRLNGFRMVSTNLSPRVKEYCSRAFHLFPACVGGCFAPNYEIIELF